jgi:hypothetical protein
VVWTVDFASTHHMGGDLMSSGFVLVGVLIVSLILLDILALRFGVDSHSPSSDQKDWW